MNHPKSYRCSLSIVYWYKAMLDNGGEEGTIGVGWAFDMSAVMLMINKLAKLGDAMASHLKL